MVHLDAILISSLYYTREKKDGTHVFESTLLLPPMGYKELVSSHNDNFLGGYDCWVFTLLGGNGLRVEVARGRGGRP
jgi:hypothetical protein